MTAFGATAAAVGIFEAYMVSGKTVVAGISDEDLVDMGVGSRMQRRGIMDILHMMVVHGLLMNTCNHILILE